MISLTDTGLNTQRNLNTTWFLFVGTLLGSVFGILGSYAFLMGVFEIAYEIFHERINKNIWKKYLSKNTEHITSNFSAFQEKQKNEKILPRLGDESTNNF